MASTIRRNTFILSDASPSQVPVPKLSAADRQNIMRLKVNRIALVQELRVEHILGFLTKSGVLTESDLRKIHSSKTSQDRARILIDILPTKPKDSNWYKCFRDALLNPDGSNNAKQRYKLLVEFLDNTVIHRPTSQAGKFSEIHKQNKKMKYPRYNPLPEINERNMLPNVLNLEHEKTIEEDKVSIGHLESDFDKASMLGGDSQVEHEKVLVGSADIHLVDHDRISVWDRNNEKGDHGNVSLSVSGGDSQKHMMLVKGFFHQWIPTPDNFRSLVNLPTKQIQALQKEGTPEARAQIFKEETALSLLRKLEVIFALARRRQLPVGFELCLCSPVQEMLAQPQLFHLYLKYIHTLKSADIYIIRDICKSYDNTLGMFSADPSLELKKQLTQTGFRLSDWLITMEMFSQAEALLESVVSFLRANPGLETWTDEYNTHVRLMGVYNRSGQLVKAQQSYFLAIQVTYQVQLISFGQNILFEGRLHQETSAMLLEFGSVNSAFGWSRRALQEVDPEDHAAVIETLTQAVMTHCACWQVKKAEMLAVYAVQLAHEKFGKHHPIFLKALSTLCHFCNEFKQGPSALQLAKELLELTEVTYGCESMHLASAYRTLSKALMSQQIVLTDDSYYTHAMEAIRIARSQLPDEHPLLHPYLSNFAMALQWKSLNCPKEVQDSTLHWAETEAQQALSIVTKHYSEISLKAAQILTLLGQIYSKMNEMEVAEKHLALSVEYLQLCQPSNSNYLLLSYATLGTFYKVTGNIQKAIYYLRQVIMKIESKGYYLKWVHTCFEMLIDLVHSEVGSGNTNQGAGADEVNRLQVQLALWLKENPKDETLIDTASLSSTPMIFGDFLEKFDVWGSTAQKVHKLKDPDMKSTVD